MSPLRSIIRPGAKCQILCVVCHEPVELENSKTDENGRAIHEDCYIRVMQQALDGGWAEE
jgi:hypothetical protein